MVANWPRHSCIDSGGFTVGIRDLEDVLDIDDMVVTLEAALITLRTPTTVDKLTDHLDITDGELASLEARITFILNGG